jgi:hypothetical protein
MPRITVTLEADLMDLLQRHKPKRQALSAFCADLLEIQTLGLDSASNLPAYRVGAGNTGHLTTETGSYPQPEQSSAEVHLSPTEKFFSTDLPTIGMGDGVGRESEGGPRKGVKEIPGNLLAHEDLIRDFWRIKGGSKGDRAWSLLLTELTKIQDLHGDGVLRQQLELAINGKWKGITLANLERFTPARNTQPSTASGAPMTHMEQTVASFIRKQRAMEEGRAAA